MTPDHPHDDRLGELLSRADRTAARSGVSPDLSARARRALVRRRTTRRMAGGVLAALLLLWMLPSAYRPLTSRDHPNGFASQEAERALLRLSELDLEIRWRNAMVTRLVELEAESTLRNLATSFPADPRVEARQQLERAARTLVEAGDRLLINERPLLAAETYARVIDAFPSSTWAAAAGERIDRLRVR